MVKRKALAMDVTSLQMAAPKVTRTFWVRVHVPADATPGLNAGSVTIKNKEKGPLTLAIAKDCLLFVKGKPGQAALADFKVGEEVHLYYSQAGTAIVCHSMWQPGANPREKEHEVENKAKTP